MPYQISGDGIELKKTLDVIEYLLQVLPRLSVDPTNYLRVSPSALIAGTAYIGYVGLVQKPLAAPYADTVTSLGANAVFTGTSRNTQISTSSPYSMYAGIIAASYADVAGTLFIQESTDNSAWRTVARQDAVGIVDTDGATTRYVAQIAWKAAQIYVRVMYRNGAGAQAAFNLSSRIIGAL
jgi:hypothetical protein